MSNYLDEYVGVQDRLKAFIDKFPDYRIKTHVLEESLAKDCGVYIVKTELYRTEADPVPWTTGLSSESKEKQCHVRWVSELNTKCFCNVENS